MITSLSSAAWRWEREHGHTPTHCFLDEERYLNITAPRAWGSALMFGVQLCVDPALTKQDAPRFEYRPEST